MQISSLAIPYFKVRGTRRPVSPQTWTTPAAAGLEPPTGSRVQGLRVLGFRV